MADKSTKKVVKLAKQPETLRQKAEKAAAPRKPRATKLRSAASKASKPFKAAHRVGKKEYYLPLPDNRLGRFLNKRRRATPRFFVNAWKELRLVEWPNGRETMRLVFAVFIFSFVFGLIIAITDFGLDKVFRKVFVE